ncbi:hypothetical protein FB45DRAFT_900678, partial [Roridomyces roridus]
MECEASTDVQELQAQIDKVCKDIEFQKQALRNLERSKSVLQRQLNTLRDPIARLPVEVSSEIFLQCLPPRPELGVHRVPMLFLHVCNTWTDIALSDPALWATMYIDPKLCTDGFEQASERWLQRAGVQPLHLSTIATIDARIADLLWRYSSRLESLELAGLSYKDMLSDRPYGSFDCGPLLGGAPPVSLPLLHTLSMTGSSSLEFSLSSILQLLSLAPNLVNVVFRDVMIGLDVDESTPVTVLPSVRCLGVEDNNQYRGTNQHRLLGYVATPRLDALIVYQPDVYKMLDMYSLFIQRSSPPLRKLIIRNCSDAFKSLNKYISLVSSTLTHLDIPSASSICLKLLESLAQPSADLLPLLEVLKLGRVYPDDWDRDGSSELWDVVLRVLAVRRVRMRIFRMTFALNVPEIPSAVMIAFKDVMASGMDIWIESTWQEKDRNVNVLA